MVRALNKIPLNIAVLILGIASAGNLIVSYGKIYKYIFGLLSAFLLVVLILKLITNYKEFLGDLNKPLVLGTVATVPMAIMVLLTYIHGYSKTITFVIWILAIVTMCVLFVYYTKLYLFSNFDISNMFPSTIVVYVGICVASVTAPVFKAEMLGQIIFWYSFAAFLVVTPVIAYRVLVVRGISEAVKPTIAIFVAPGFLCLAGYLSSFKTPNVFFVSAVLILSILIYLVVLFYLLTIIQINPVKFLKEKFYSSYSALTFPFVISAISLNKSVHYYSLPDVALKVPLNLLKDFALGATALAVFVVVYVVVRYVMGMYEIYTDDKIRDVKDNR